MNFTIGDRVRFRGDPDEEIFRVGYVNGDNSVDLEDPTGNIERWEYIPNRLLEKYTEPVAVGDVYRGDVSGDLYFVVGVRYDAVYYVDEARPDQVVREVGSVFGGGFTKVRSGEDLR